MRKAVFFLMVLLSGSARALIIPERVEAFNDVNQLDGSGMLVEACNAGSPNRLAIPDIVTFEGYTDPLRGTLDHLYLFGTYTNNNAYSTNYYRPDTHAEGYETISGMTENEARILFETRRFGSGAAPQRTRLYFEGLDTNSTYLIQVLTVNDAHTDLMYAQDANQQNEISADDTQNAVMLFTFRGKPRMANDDFVYFQRGNGSAELNAYQIRQLDNLPSPLEPAHLTLRCEGGTLHVQSVDLPETATNVLQLSTNLATGVWVDLEESTGVASNEWLVEMTNSPGYLRVESRK